MIMEDSAKNLQNGSPVLGGGPPTPEEERTMNEQVDRVVAQAEAALGGVQPAPKAVQLEEADHLKYQLLGSRVNASDLKIAMYERELQHAQVERAKLAHEVAVHVRHLESKYGADMRSNMVTEDGFLAPRSPEERARLFNALPR